MSELVDPDDDAKFERLMPRLRELAAHIGLSEAKTERILKQIIVDMPLHTDEECIHWARSWMLASVA